MKESAVPIARANWPCNDPAYQRPAGSGAGAAGESSSSGAPVLPAILPGYAALPPPLLLVARSRAALCGTTAQRRSVALGGGLGNWLPLDPQTSFWSSLSSIQGVSLAIALAPCGATAGAEPP